MCSTVYGLVMGSDFPGECNPKMSIHSYRRPTKVTIAPKSKCKSMCLWGLYRSRGRRLE